MTLGWQHPGITAKKHMPRSGKTAVKAPQATKSFVWQGLSFITTAAVWLHIHHE